MVQELEGKKAKHLAHYELKTKLEKGETYD
jgi:hypothetical protein